MIARETVVGDVCPCFVIYVSAVSPPRGNSWKGAYALSVATNVLALANATGPASGAVGALWEPVEDDRG